jgi:D-glycero-alpha-D-manno-heptose-7-phosphate kinase
MKITSLAPCRISLVGGGTDVDPFASTYGGQVLNLTVNLYHQVILRPHSSTKINLEALGESRDLVLTKNRFIYGTDKKFDLLRAIINYFLVKIPSGFSLKVLSPKTNVLGLGRSGSAAVAAVGAFNSWLKTNLNRKEIGLLASDLEINDLGWPGGKQDGLAAAYGGVNLMSFGPGDKTRVLPLKLTKKAQTEFHRRIFMVFVGGDRHSADQQKKLVTGMSDKQKLTAMFALKKAVPPAVSALKKEDWPGLGRILHQGWEDKKKSNPAVTNPIIDKFYALALKSGAYGGKISGSGGAGNMFFLIPPQKKQSAVKALVKAGAAAVDFTLDNQGLTVKKYDN